MAYSSYITTRYTPYYYDPIIVSSYESEFNKMKDTLRQNQYAVDRMIDQVRVERRRIIDHSNMKCSALANQVAIDQSVIGHLESDLSTWKSRFNNMHTRFDSLRTSLAKKDYNMEQMRAELDRCNATVSEVVNKSKAAQDQYHKLADDMKWKKVRWEQETRDATRDVDYYGAMRTPITRFRPLTTYRSQFDLYDPAVKVITHYY
jgi:chromosome segregation ATPase